MRAGIRFWSSALACGGGLEGHCRARVVSFEQLAKEVLEECGGAAVPEIDALGRQTKITQPDPDGAGSLTRPFTTFAYDAAGNLLSVTDPLNHVTSYEYDDLHRRIKITDAESGETTFGYDSAGRLLSLTDPVSIRRRGNTTSLAARRPKRTR